MIAIPPRTPRTPRTPRIPPGYCACGQPLHYSDPALHARVDRFARDLGDTIAVTYDGVDGYFRVQRHYLALHGIKGAELQALAAAGIIEWVGHVRERP